MEETYEANRTNTTGIRFRRGQPWFNGPYSNLDREPLIGVRPPQWQTQSITRLKVEEEFIKL